MKPRENPYTGQLLFDFVPLPDPDWRFTLRPVSHSFRQGEPVRLFYTITHRDRSCYLYPPVEFHFLNAPGGTPEELLLRRPECPVCGRSAERHLWWHADPVNHGFADLDRHYELVPGDYVVVARRLVGRRANVLWIQSNDVAFRVWPD